MSDLKLNRLMQLPVNQEALFFEAFDIAYKNSLRFIEEYYVTLIAQKTIGT